MRVWPLGIDLQELMSNYLNLPCLRGSVVSVEEKS